MHLKSLAGLTVVGLALFGSVAHADLITNGSFETSTYTSSSQFGTNSGGNGTTSWGGQGVTGWTGNGGYNILFKGGTATTVSAATQYNSGPNTGAEKLYSGINMTGSGTVGASFVALDGDSGVGGGISQEINGLVVGQQYVLQFDWGAGQMQSRTGDTTEQFQVSLGSQTISTPVAKDPSQSFTGWFHQAFTYTATGTSELLSFLSVGTPNGLPPIATLDGVSLNAVPEPVSVSLLGAGLVSAGLLRRKRSRKVS